MKRLLASRSLRIALSASSLAFVLSACDERVEAEYASLNEARAAGAVERGWIPLFVPDSAFAIRDTHDLDTSRQTLRFSVPTQTAIAMAAAQTPLPSGQMESVRTSLSKAGWSGEGPGVRILAVCRVGDEGYLAVDTASGRALYLREPHDRPSVCAEP